MPTESTLVFLPGKGESAAHAAADKAACEAFAHAKVEDAREARVTKDTIGQVAAMGLGAAGGGLVGSQLGATGLGAASGAAAGGAYGAAAGMFGGLANSPPTRASSTRGLPSAPKSMAIA
jgi:hypothetical protein